MTDQNPAGIFRFGRLHPAVRFVVFFVVFLLILSVLFSIASAVFHPQMVSLMALTAHIVGGLLDLAGTDVFFHGRTIAAPGLAVYSLGVICARSY